MNNPNPTWGYTIFIPTYLPTMNNLLSLKLYDYDRGSPDELVATVIYNIRDI
jgi:Ca2+-dependent lipid-binding protein